MASTPRYAKMTNRLPLAIHLCNNYWPHQVSQPWSSMLRTLRPNQFVCCSRWNRVAAPDQQWKSWAGFCSSCKAHSHNVSLEPAPTEAKLEGLLSHINNLGKDVEPVLPDVLKQLVEMRYRDIQHSMPWLDNSFKMARLQLHIGGLLQDEMQPVTGSSVFEGVLDILQRRMQMLPLRTERNYWDNALQGDRNSAEVVVSDCEHTGKLAVTDLPKVLTQLKFLGFENEPVMQNLWLHCAANFDQCDYESLSHFINAVPQMSKGAVMKPFLTALSKLVQTSKISNGLEMACFSQILRSCSGFMTSDVLHRYLSLLTAAGKELLPEIGHSAHIATLAHSSMRVHRLSVFADNKEAAAKGQQLVRMTVERGKQMIDELIPKHLGRISNSAWLAGLFRHNLLMDYESKAVELLSSDLRVCDVVHLMAPMSLSTERKVLEKMDSILLSKLDEVDAIMVANIARAYMRIYTRNKDVISRLHSLIIEHFDVFIQYVTFLYPIMNFLDRFPFRKRADIDLYRQGLLQVVYSQPDGRSSVLPNAVYFFISSSKEKLPEPLFQQVMEVMPNMDLHALHWIMMGLKKSQARAPIGQATEKQKQLMQLQHHLFHQVSEKLGKGFKQPHILSHQAHMLLTQPQFYEPALSNKVMEMFLELSKDENLPFTSFRNITGLFHKTAYFMPEVCDNLTALAIRGLRHRPLMSIYGYVSKLLKTLTKVNYVPKDFSTLAELTFNVLLLEQRHAVRDLRMLNGFSQLQYHSEQHLSQVFTLEYIEGVERLISDYPHHRPELESSLMHLNRSVVLECPQLDVPWFNENFFDRHPLAGKDGMHESLKLPDRKQTLMQKEVESCLNSVLGGRQYFKASTFTQYFYSLDFECVLDQDGKAVAYDQKPAPHMKKLPESCQRVAILLLQRSDFCCNVPRLLGFPAQKQRHLEIMGYKVVQVPYTEWYSMGMQDQETRVQCLTHKIFH